jgi:hypothetical protein
MGYNDAKSDIRRPIPRHHPIFYAVDGLRKCRAYRCHETPGSYTNVDGQEVHRPECLTTHQEGETAIAMRVPTVFPSTIRAHARIMAASPNGNKLTRVALIKFANKRQEGYVLTLTRPGKIAVTRYPQGKAARRSNLPCRFNRLFQRRIKSLYFVPAEASVGLDSKQLKFDILNVSNY